MSKTLYGTTDVTIGEETYTLTPSLGAVRSIESRFNGLRGAVMACQDMSVDGVTHIIASGAGIKPKQINDLAESVWAAGVSEVVAQVMPYLTALLNPKNAKVDEDDSGNAKKATVTVQ